MEDLRASFRCIAAGIIMGAISTLYMPKIGVQLFKAIWNLVGIFSHAEDFLVFPLGKGIEME